PFIQDVILHGEKGGKATLRTVFDDGVMANTIDEDVYQAAKGRIGDLAPSQRVLRMADGHLVESRGIWYGGITFGSLRKWGQFEVFPSGGAWVALFGKPLLETFGAWHGYEEDVIVLLNGDQTVRVPN
ncbi:hypothetical protein C8R45DRAFT_773245, partial [Mycena sanguinolenta]